MKLINIWGTVALAVCMATGIAGAVPQRAACADLNNNGVCDAGDVSVDKQIGNDGYFSTARNESGYKAPEGKVGLVLSGKISGKGGVVYLVASGDIIVNDLIGSGADNSAVILVSTIFVILETEVTIYEPHRRIFQWSEAFMLVFFSVEYLLRIWTAAENPKYRSRLGYALSPVAILDLVVIVSMGMAFLGLEGSLLRLLRLIRLLRLAKLGKYSKALKNIGEAIAERRFELLVSLFIAFGLLLASASALYLIEGERQPEVYGSIPRSMWWSVATLTTVGYGDCVPMTPLGKVFASFTALMGIGLIAMPTGILASAFSAAMQKKEHEEQDS
ncbi:MAG: ion transporter [Verrucomicrobiales bacterium]